MHQPALKTWNITFHISSRKPHGFPSPSAKLQVMRRQSDKACLATMSVLRQSHPFLLTTKGLACVNKTVCVMWWRQDWLKQDKRARRPFCYQSHKTRLLETWVSKDLKDFPGKACGMTTPPTTTRNHAKASSIEKYTSLSSRGGSLQTPANQAGCHPVVGHWNYL